MPIAASDLTGGYSKQAIIRDISVTLHDGEWLTLIGANGSGKSTLLRLLSRLLPRQRGQVFLAGDSLDGLSNQAVAQKLAVQTQQQPSVPGGMTVWQLVAMGRSPHQPWWQWDSSPEDRFWIENALESTDLRDFAERPLVQLSGGERQRAFLALALAQNPQVLFLDEPTTFLDVRYQLELLELLKRLNRDRRLSIVTVLHEINLAARYSHRLALIQEGQIREIGPPKEVLTSENLKQVFDIEALILDTPVGLQVCPLRPAHSH
ncbi:ABC transporter ATP-binding protein [Geitlerinema sp. P-1104]|nr:ABC transporter ATP-binding protein [Geitlerinema sp. P-1104]